MNLKLTSSFLLASASLLLSTGAFAQNQAPALQFPSASPTCTVKDRVGLTDIEIVYSRPGVKDRTIFGGIVPYGQVWRTGANASTKISFSTPVKLGGHEIPAGKYALYTIPGEKEWTIIIYKNPNLGGAFGYDQKDDLVRFTVEPVDVGFKVETFTMDLSDLRDDSATLYLIWEHTYVPIHLEVDVTSKLVPQIEAAMSATEGQKPYYQAAVFYYEHGLDIQKARKWIEAASAEREAYYIKFYEAKILAKAGDKEKAIAAAKRSSELAIKAEGPQSGYVKMNQDLISSLQ
jgi:hypothetical protein